MLISSANFMRNAYLFKYENRRIINTQDERLAPIMVSDTLVFVHHFVADVFVQTSGKSHGLIPRLFCSMRKQ